MTTMTQEYAEIMDDVKNRKATDDKRKAHIAVLRDVYERACNMWVKELLLQWECDEYYGSWIGGDSGGTYDYDSGWTLTMEEIIYCVEHDVTENEVIAWQDYCVEASEFNISTPNLKAWHEGCPRTSEETFARFRQLRADLQQACEEENKRNGY